ncbi:MAG: DNA-deoxyinosine glycosylase [Clostridia bacterium]|nr:DNA-deoxyinosine glycosylase [Clostridia bacterium]
MDIVHVVHPFEPLFSPESRVLILGSFPSVKSREQGFFYGHRQNRFWPMLAAVYGERAPDWADIPAKRDLVLRHHLALWDSIYACDITGSSDASVRNAVPIDIARITGAARIERILCNGALSGRLYRQYLEPVTGIPALVLPSTSPANAAFSMDRLVEAWGAALQL